MLLGNHSGGHGAQAVTRSSEESMGERIECVGWEGGKARPLFFLSLDVCMKGKVTTQRRQETTKAILELCSCVHIYMPTGTDGVCKGSSAELQSRRLISSNKEHTGGYTQRLQCGEGKPMQRLLTLVALIASL